MSDGELLQKVLLQLGDLGVLRTRKMFGGQYIYCDDLFIATIHDGELYLKANQHTAAAFLALNCRVFSYPTKTGTVTLQHYQAPPGSLDRKEELQRWGRLALLAARQGASLPKKRPGRGKAK